jgi:D-glycero-alpha-D-manno-heptose-7-phosphate kinase
LIIVRSPLRITLGGGGTDLASFYEKHDGFVLSAAIDKYVYVSAIKPFSEGIFLKYSSIEHVASIEEIRHPIVRESINLVAPELKQIEITTLADIPSGTGLGSSGSFTTSLLKTLHTFSNSSISADQLAEMACHVEIEILAEPIGKQDQYAAAFGGISCFTFKSDNTVDVVPLNISSDTLLDLEDNLLLFFTGFSRSASKVLGDQNTRSINGDKVMLDNLQYVKKLGYLSRDALEKGNCKNFGEIMNLHWENKKQRSQGMSNKKIDNWYNIALQNGAVGGKVVGAGGGGFLMFYAHDRNKLRRAMTQEGLQEVRFKFDFEGTKVVLS